MYNINNNKGLLVIKQTSKTSKEKIIEAFKNFSLTTPLNPQSILSKIDRHGMYMQSGKYYFKYNSRLSFMQKFRINRTSYLKLEEFYNEFSDLGILNKPSLTPKTWFWTITRKTFPLENMNIELKERKLRSGEIKENVKITFDEINNADNNLKALFKRLERYGFKLKKYILVPEIKDNGDLFNYHYHMIVEPLIDLKKIRRNKRIEYQDLVYDEYLQEDRVDGFINIKTLSAIWKEITKDGSYRILPEEIRSKMGAFNYLLAYLNKPMQYQDVDNIPKMYFALKSKKAYRVKGKDKPFPKIKCELYDIKDNRIRIDFNNITLWHRDEIPIKKQSYKTKLFRNDELIEEVLITEIFDIDNLTLDDKNLSLANFDGRLIKARYHKYIKRYGNAKR